MIDFTTIYQWKGLELLNKHHKKFYESCDLTKKYFEYSSDLSLLYYHFLTKKTTKDKAIPIITVIMTTIDKRTGMLSAVWTFGEDRKYPPLPSKMIRKFCIKIEFFFYIWLYTKFELKCHSYYLLLPCRLIWSSFGTQLNSTGVHDPFWRQLLSTIRVRLAVKIHR